jgi:O-antigen/teichoic acid export membrane protein
VTTRRPALARSAALNLAGYVIPLVVAVAAIPFTVRALGLDQFGLLAFAWVVFAYSTVFDLGVSRALTRYAAEAISADDSDRLSRLFWNALLANTLLGMCGALLFLLVSPHLAAALNVPPHLMASAQKAMYVVAAAIPATLVTTTFRGLLEADYRFDLVNLVTVPSSVLLYVLPAIASIAGFDVPFILTLILLSRIGSAVAFVRLTRNAFPRLRLHSLDGKTLRQLFAYGGWVTVSGIAGTIFAYADRILISLFRGVGAVTFYAVPYEVVARMWILPTAISAVLFPAFSARQPSSPVDLRQLYGQAFVALLSLTAAVVVALVLIGKELLTLWVGASLATPSAPVLRVLAIGVGINSLAFVPFALIQGVSRPDLTGKLHGLSLVPFLAVGVVLAEALGPIGVALAFTLRLSTEATLLFLTAARIAPRLSSVLVTTRILISIAAAASVVVAAALLIAFDAPLVVRSSFVVVTTVLALAAIWGLGLEPSQRGDAIGRLMVFVRALARR